MSILEAAIHAHNRDRMLSHTPSGKNHWSRHAYPFIWLFLHFLEFSLIKINSFRVCSKLIIFHKFSPSSVIRNFLLCLCQEFNELASASLVVLNDCIALYKKMRTVGTQNEVRSHMIQRWVDRKLLRSRRNQLVGVKQTKKEAKKEGESMRSSQLAQLELTESPGASLSFGFASTL